MILYQILKMTLLVLRKHVMRELEILRDCLHRIDIVMDGGLIIAVRDLK